MAYFPFQPGQQPMSSSQGVVIASNQSPVSVAGTLNITGNPSISGTVQVGNFPTTQNVSGSVVATQGTNPWIITGSVQASLTPAANQSVSGTVGASIIGLAPVSVSNFPTSQNVSGSVVAFQGTSPWVISSVYGNIAGSVVAFQGAGWSGSVAATITNTNVNVSGSVVSSQGTNPWIVGSIVGTYAEDSASANTDKGFLTLGVRNDTVASLVNADLDYTAWSTDSAGRHLIKPFAADEARLDTVSSVVSGSVTALFNSVVGLRNYVTDIMIANTGSVQTLVTFKDGSTSILGYTIAPAGGGSNINGMAFPLRTAPAQDFVYSVSPSSSVLYVTAKGYKAP